MPEDTIPKVESQPEKPLVELGVGGYKQYGGYIYDEFLPELSGDRGRRKFREMYYNDSVISACINAIDMLLRSVDWHVDPNEKDKSGEGAIFVEDLMKDLNEDQSWGDFISDALTMLVYGWSLCEIVYKRREDGRIGWDKIAPRSQMTLQRWEIDERGEVQGFYQLPPNGGKILFIPKEKFLLFKTTRNYGNPEGLSLLRNVYESWYFKKQIQFIEATAIERELAGLPVVSIPNEYLANVNNDPKISLIKAKYEQIARDLKFNSQGALVIPSDTFPDVQGNPTNIPIVTVQLMSSSGTRSIDMTNTLNRIDNHIARRFFAGFMLLGSQSNGGSFALGKTQADLFIRSLDCYSKIIEEQADDLIDRTWVINGLDPDTKPKIRAGQIAPVDLDAIGKYISALSNTGIMLAGDAEMEDYLKDLGGLPKNGKASPVADPTLPPDKKPKPNE